MRITAKQTTTRTLTDLYRALDRSQPVTITYLKEETREVFAVNSKGTAVRRTIRTGRLIETIRTIETIEITTTKAGAIIIRAMDRQSGEARTFRADRIKAYTRHTGATYQVERTTDDTTSTAATTTPLIPRSTAQVIARELGRDYLPTHRYAPAA
jgi:predicted DNA-binding transcriptional regulator YafY